MTAPTLAPDFVDIDGDDPMFDVPREDQAPAPVANPDAPYGTKADGTPKAKPGPRPGTTAKKKPTARTAKPNGRRPTIRKAAPKKAAPSAPFTVSAPAPEAKTTNTDAPNPALKYGGFLAGIAGIPQAALFTAGLARKDTALQADAAVIGNLAAQVAVPLGEIIAEHPDSQLARYIDKAMEVSPWFAIAMPCISAVFQALHNHGALPPLMGAMPPRFLAATMRQRSAEFLGGLAGQDGSVDYASAQEYAEQVEQAEAVARGFQE